MINTAKSPDRRKLRFNSSSELFADIAKIAASAEAGTLRIAGNWTPGQIFGHLAAFIDYAYDGYPPEIANPPWFVKIMVRLMKRKFLHGSMPAGVKIPGTNGGTTGIESISLDEGLERLTRAWKRMESTPPKVVGGAFGALTHEERILLNLRHAELHLSFLHP